MSLDPSLFVSLNVHARDVELGDGKTHPMHFREIPLDRFRAWQMAESGDDDAARVKAPAMLIAAGVCEPDGSNALTAEQAANLKPLVAQKLMAAIMEVNEFTGKKGSPSAESSGSATS